MRSCFSCFLHISLKNSIFIMYNCSSLIVAMAIVASKKSPPHCPQAPPCPCPSSGLNLGNGSLQSCCIIMKHAKRWCTEQVTCILMAYHCADFYKIGITTRYRNLAYVSSLGILGSIGLLKRIAVGLLHQHRFLLGAPPLPSVVLLLLSSLLTSRLCLQ